MEPILEVRNLNKFYKSKQVLKNISIKVFKGDIYGFIGPNGAGKTTTIKSILGLVSPSSGEIYIKGRNIVKDKYKNPGDIGAMIDCPSFYNNLSAFRNLKLYANVLDLKEDRIMEVLNMVHFQEYKDRRVSNYSMGMKQRLAVARAFLSKPEIVILDEPTNGLDPEGVRDMRNLVEKLSKDEKVTFIYCSHILNEVQNLCSRVAVINKGSILAEGCVDELLNADRERYSIFTGEAKKLKKVLKDYCLEMHDIEGGVSIEINRGDFKLINKVMAEENVEINDIVKKSTSLEEYFMEEVGYCGYDKK
ncbi:ABC transporter ATP-binding protein [Clostridium sp. MT-14]|uniref:ABC transporter ATP-binding protein n=1 Tax=unclassified Clostridium TaxID=2614128 RepID=UPI001238E7F0|nr:ATP-binding cassette domain-containing protein [Clostridium sp. HV4-5-A1G]KAA8680165.1 ATP-binding cassette domain-containing protein [Clostridium sp. HV4-5-A1G]